MIDMVVSKVYPARGRLGWLGVLGLELELQNEGNGILCSATILSLSLQLLLPRNERLQKC